MKPIISLFWSVVITIMVMVSLGFLASVTPIAGNTLLIDTADANEEQQVVETEQEGLEIIIAGIRSDRGRIILAVFDSAKSFAAYDYESAIELGEFDAVSAVEGKIKVTLPHLSSGPYAISLFHDENNDYDFNMDGQIPLEGYGTSGAENAYDEPSFREASVEAGKVIVQVFYL